MATESTIKQYILNSDKPGALYSLSRLKKVEHLNLPTKPLENFYKENDVLRQFYGAKNLPKKKIVRNGYACFPLERIHIDLCEMTKEHGSSPYRYILFAIDNYSRYAFFVLLKTKQAREMEMAAINLLSQMRPFRKLSFNQSSVFMSDLGTEFITTFRQVLLKAGHYFVNLATSESKAFYVERFIRTFRMLLKVKQVALDLDHKDFERWDTLVSQIVKVYNATPHKGIHFSAPIDYINLSKKAVMHSANNRSSINKKSFLENLKAYSNNVPFKVGDYVNITTAKKNIFSKASARGRIGLEVFKVVKVRPPILDNNKLSYYFLEDMTGKQITGAFYESNLVGIPPSSRRHPLNTNFKKTVARIVSTSQTSRGTLYKVNFSGNDIFFFCTCKRDGWGRLGNPSCHQD